jgi:hypothetical protein
VATGSERLDQYRTAASTVRTLAVSDFSLSDSASNCAVHAPSVKKGGSRTTQAKTKSA